MAGDYQKALESFVTSEKLTLCDTYFMGHKTEKGTWMVVAELKVQQFQFARECITNLIWLKINGDSSSFEGDSNNEIVLDGSSQGKN